MNFIPIYVNILYVYINNISCSFILFIAAWPPRTPTFPISFNHFFSSAVFRAETILMWFLTLESWWVFSSIVLVSKKKLAETIGFSPICTTKINDLEFFKVSGEGKGVVDSWTAINRKMMEVLKIDIHCNIKLKIKTVVLVITCLGGRFGINYPSKFLKIFVFQNFQKSRDWSVPIIARTNLVITG